MPVSSSSTCGFWSWNVGTGEIWANRQTRRILGLEEGARLVPVELLARIDPTDRAAVLRTIAADPPRRKTMELELRVTVRGGERRWITAKARTYRDPNGGFLRATGYVIDDTRRKEIEPELLRQREKLTHLHVRSLVTPGETKFQRVQVG